MRGRTGLRRVLVVRGLAALPAPRLRGWGRTTCRPPRPGAAPVPPAEPARIGPAWRGRGAPCSASLPPAACSAPCQVPGAAARGAPGGVGTARGAPRGGERSIGGSRRGSAGARAPPSAGGAGVGGSGEPSLRTEASREQRPGPDPQTRAKCPRPRAPSPRRARRSGRPEMLGSARASPALKAAARPPAPALPIQGSCRLCSPAGRAGPGSPPRSNGELEGTHGERSSEPGGTRSIQPCEAPVSSPAAPGCLQAAAEFPTEGTADKARALPPPCRHRAPILSRCGRGGDAGAWDRAGARPRPRAASPTLCFSSAPRATCPQVCRHSLQQDADSPVCRDPPHGWERASSWGPVAIPRDPGSDKV